METLSLRHLNREFRVSWALRAALLAALAIWLGLAVVAATLDEVPAHVFAGISFFVAFFVLCVRYYFRLSYVVDDAGLTYRGASALFHFGWDEIERVEESEILLGGSTVTTKHGQVVLNRFVHGYADLVEVIVARAGLFPV